MDSLTSIVDKYNRLVYSVINKFSNYFDIDDLYQVGVIGLINARKNYDGSKGTKFSTYAYYYILGEVKKYIREDKGVKVSKELLSLNKKINKMKSLLSQKLMREPSISELATYLNMDYQRIVDVMNLSDLMVSLDEDKDDINMYDKLGYEEKSYNEDILDLREQVNCLSDFEKSIIKKRYFEDRTQSEVSNMLGITQVKVSREEKAILNKLRVRLR